MKYILLLLIISINYNGNSQTLVKENKLWSNTEFGTEHDTPYKSYNIKFYNDTTINDLVYKKIWRSNDSLQTNWFQSGYIREDSTKKVYQYNKYYQKDELLYDFGVEVGDSIIVYYISDSSYFHYIYANYITYIKLENSPDSVRKIYFYSSPDTLDGYLTAIWIETVGSTWGILCGLNYIDLVGADLWLVCYFENDTLKYHSNSFTGCFPTGFPESINENIKNNNIIKTSNNNLQLSFDFVSLNTKNSLLQIYKLNGVLILEKKLNGEKTIQIPCNTFLNGIYFYRFVNNNTAISDKFLITY
ncbi:MAG: T9SS type A sorting domain-containing protein [Bacteroidales bacterium]|nr:T9SS type A sorting domain-containing protein [Bacteroidales bacterium]